jgi:ATP-dependent protease ClpP protease subunit
LIAEEAKEYGMIDEVLKKLIKLDLEVRYENSSTF